MEPQVTYSKNKGKKERLILWAGNTGVGKSTSIKLLTGNEDIKLAQSGASTSTTKNISLYRNNEKQKVLLKGQYLHLDTIGFNDTQGIQSSQILRQIETVLLGDNFKAEVDEQINEISAIIIPQPLRKGPITFSLTLKALNQMLGTVPSASIIIMGTMANQTTDQLKEMKIQAIKKQMKKNNISQHNFIEFSTPYKGLPGEKSVELGQIRLGQFEELESLINNCQSFPLKALRQKRDALNRRVIQLYLEKNKIDMKQFQKLQKQKKQRQDKLKNDQMQDETVGGIISGGIGGVGGGIGGGVAFGAALEAGAIITGRIALGFVGAILGVGALAGVVAGFGVYGAVKGIKYLLKFEEKVTIEECQTLVWSQYQKQLQKQNIQSK